MREHYAVLRPKIAEATRAEIDKIRRGDYNFFTCNIVAVEPRNLGVWLQHQHNGKMVARCTRLPYSPVYRIPTPENNYVVFQTPDGNSTNGLATLFHRNWIEPRIFASANGDFDGA